MQRVSERRGGAWPARWPWSREGGAGRDGRKMAALKEGRSYGLSCGRVSDGSKVSVFHVKLTDSALRAFESYRASQDSVSLRPSIRFQGSQGVSSFCYSHLELWDQFILGPVMACWAQQ